MLFSEEPEASPSTGVFGGGSLSSGFSGGSLSVRGRVPTKSWECPQWSLNLLPLTKDGWVMKVWRYLPGSHLIHQMWFPLVINGWIITLSQTQNQNLNPVERYCCVSQIVWVFGLPT